MSDVQKMYQTLLAEGYTPKDAAKMAQKKTGFSAVTGQPIKPKGLKFSREGVRYGQNIQLKKRTGSAKKQRVKGESRFRQF